MKELFTDANFPRTEDGRVYHLGLRTGDIANRIITVGSQSRAEAISNLLDSPSTALRLSSERGFLTITGRYKDVPISIVSIGMGYPNMDFFVREARESLIGDMVIVRLGSCGGLSDLPVGSVVVPNASVGINRNYNFHFGEDNSSVNEQAYIVSNPVKADKELHDALVKTLHELRPSSLSSEIASDMVNASADSFYSSQGRQTSFPDHNENLIRHLLDTVPGIGSLEMETFHLFHLASVWKQPRPQLDPQVETLSTNDIPPPPNHFPALTSNLSGKTEPPNATQTTFNPNPESDITPFCIRAASAQMIFASRTTQDFISPQLVDKVQSWTGEAVLETLANFSIDSWRLHPEEDSVWKKN